jgi:transposase
MIPAGVQVYVASMPVDFRKGAAGLMALVRDGGADPFNGALYVFRSKRADRIKAVWFDGTGVCLFAKTPEDAQFCWPRIWAGHVAIEPCTVTCAGRWAGLEEGPTGGCEAAAIDGLKNLWHFESGF